MTDATELDEAAIRARVEAATEGPWFVEPCGDFGAKTALIPDVPRERYGVNGLNCGEDFVTAEFIAHARTDLPAALDEITRLRAALDEARQTAEQFQGANDDLREVIGNWRNKAEALTTERDEARAEVERREFEHDEHCESEYESGAHAWTPCGCWASRSEAEGLLARAEAAKSALASIRTLARSWSGRHDLLMTGDSAAHDIEAALAANTTTDEGDPS